MHMSRGGGICVDDRVGLPIGRWREGEREGEREREKGREGKGEGEGEGGSSRRVLGGAAVQSEAQQEVQHEHVGEREHRAHGPLHGEPDGGPQVHVHGEYELQEHRAPEAEIAALLRLAATDPPEPGVSRTPHAVLGLYAGGRVRVRVAAEVPEGLPQRPDDDRRGEKHGPRRHEDANLSVAQEETAGARGQATTSRVVREVAQHGLEGEPARRGRSLVGGLEG